MNSTTNKSNEITLLNNNQWHAIEDEIFLIKDFTPFLGYSVKNGMVVKTKKVVGSKMLTPYATIHIECPKVSKNVQVTGFITHKEDFINLWSAFKEAHLNVEKEEVLAFWSMQHYTRFFAKLFSVSMPKMIVMICPEGTFQTCLKGFHWPPNENPLILIYSLQSRSYWVPFVIHKKGSHIENKKV